jgi:hypothetical protein
MTMVMPSDSRRTSHSLDLGLTPCFRDSPHPPRTLDAIVRNLYAPLVKEQNRGEWGKTTPEAKHEFLFGVENLSHNLQVRGPALRLIWTGGQSSPSGIVSQTPARHIFTP